MFHRLVALAALILVISGPVRAQTAEEWAKLGARVHGGYGAFIPLGIRIGLDATSRLKAEPRSLRVTYHDNPKSPCACFADGIAIATVASVGQRSLTISGEPAPDDKAAVIVIRPRKGGAGYRYTIPMAALPRLAELNKSAEPIGRHEAVMKMDGLFEVEPTP
jgi:formylmethanofuran dehydrogenase subunit E